MFVGPLLVHFFFLCLVLINVCIYCKRSVMFFNTPSTCDLYVSLFFKLGGNIYRALFLWNNYCIEGIIKQNLKAGVEIGSKCKPILFLLFSSLTHPSFPNVFFCE